MIFTPQKIAGVSLLQLSKIEDERGYFARSFCEEEFSQAGHPFRIHQSNISLNKQKGTLRGMHYQADPTPDPKYVRCLKGAIFDVVVDLRPKSKTYLQWVGAELSGDNELAIIIPGGCAHGYITLTDDCLLQYMMGAPYVPGLAAGVRWDDPAFGIDWPAEPTQMNDRDANYPDFAVEV